MEYQLGRDDGCTLQFSGPPCCFWHKSAHEPKPQKATWLELRRLVDPCSHHTSVESNKRKVYFPTHAFQCLSVQAYGTVVFLKWYQSVGFLCRPQQSQFPHHRDLTPPVQLRNCIADVQTHGSKPQLHRIIITDLGNPFAPHPTSFLCGTCWHVWHMLDRDYHDGPEISESEFHSSFNYIYI